jgi:hypothetical protein
VVRLLSAHPDQFRYGTNTRPGAPEKGIHGGSTVLRFYGSTGRYGSTVLRESGLFLIFDINNYCLHHPSLVSATWFRPFFSHLRSCEWSYE